MHLLAPDKVLSGSSLAGPGMGEWTQYFMVLLVLQELLDCSMAQGVVPVGAVWEICHPHKLHHQPSPSHKTNPNKHVVYVKLWLGLPWWLSGREPSASAETPVQPLIQEDPTCCRPAKLRAPQLLACSLVPRSHDY